MILSPWIMGHDHPWCHWPQRIWRPIFQASFESLAYKIGWILKNNLIGYRRGYESIRTRTVLEKLSNSNWTSFRKSVIESFGNHMLWVWTFCFRVWIWFDNHMSFHFYLRPFFMWATSKTFKTYFLNYVNQSPLRANRLWFHSFHNSINLNSSEFRDCVNFDFTTFHFSN